MNLKDKLKELRKLREAALSGPFESKDYCGDTYLVSPDYNIGEDGAFDKETAKFIMKSANNWISLIDSLEIAVNQLSDYSRDHERGHHAKDAIEQIKIKLGCV
jgi:hypothetical protein